jgi:hypothetical protein
LKITEIAKILRYFFHVKNYAFWQKMGKATFWAVFLTNATGHTAPR